MNKILVTQNWQILVCQTFKLIILGFLPISTNYKSIS